MLSLQQSDPRAIGLQVPVDVSPKLGEGKYQTKKKDNHHLLTDAQKVHILIHLFGVFLPVSTIVVLINRKVENLHFFRKFTLTYFFYSLLWLKLPVLTVS